MKKTAQLLVCTAFALCTLHGSALFAQGALPTSAALQKAIVVEEIEHDARGALALYSELSQDPALPDAVRRHAALRLGRAQALLGDLEAARASLTLAAAGDDEVARLAQKELQDPGANAERARLLNEEARRWIERTRTGYKPAGIQNDEAPKNLLALGEAAVPELIRAIEAEPQHSKAAVYAALLWRIGGDEAAAYLTNVQSNPDVDLRRLVVSGLEGNNARDDQMVAIAQGFLADDDPQGVVQARTLGANVKRPGQPFHTLIERYEATALLPLVDSGVPQVRVAVLTVLANSWRAMHHNGRQAANMDALAPGLERALDDVHAEVRKAAQLALARLGMQSPGVRALLVRRLPSVGQDISLYGDSTKPSSADQPTIERLLPMLLKLGSATRPKPTPRDRAVDRLVGFYLDALDASNLELVLTYQRLGYDQGRQVPQWIYQNCRAAQGERILEAIVESPELSDLLQWCAEYPLTPRSEQLLVTIDQALLEERGPTDWEPSDNERYNVRVALGYVGTPSALARVMQDIGETVPASLYTATAKAVLHASERRQDADVIDALRRVLVLETDNSRAYTQDPAQMRQMVLARLIELGDAAAVALVGTASELGLRRAKLEHVYPTESPFHGFESGDYNWLSLNQVVDGERVFFHGFGAAELAEVWSALLQPGRSTAGPSPWRYVEVAMAPGRSGGVRRHKRLFPVSYGDLSPELIQVFAMRWAEQVELLENVGKGIYDRSLANLLDILRLDLLSNPKSVSALMDLRRACFASSRGTYRELAIATLPRVLDQESRNAVQAALHDPDWNVVYRAIDTLRQEGQPFPADLFAMLLENSSASARKYAITSLAPLVEEDAVQMVGRLLTDSDSGVREAACHFLGTQTDLRQVPKLLIALRDIEEPVRIAAADALRAIRFYHDEKAHWDRVFAGTEVSQGGAASALLKQAASGNPREIRLLALRSLGSLGAPQTLPFLIEWTTDEDEELAAQARSAISLIHTMAENK